MMMMMNYDCVRQTKSEIFQSAPILAIVLLVTIYYYNRRRRVSGRRYNGERLSKVSVVRLFRRFRFNDDRS